MTHFIHNIELCIIYVTPFVTTLEDVGELILDILLLPMEMSIFRDEIDAAFFAAFFWK